MIQQIANRIYYIFRPVLPRIAQLELRRFFIQIKLEKYKNSWPIDTKAAKKPENWKGWPHNKKFVLVLTHDVDTAWGHDKCFDLIGLEEKLGFRSSFNFVPERYKGSPKIRQYLQNHGFEVGVHGLVHDGKLYQSRKIFQERAVKINRYLTNWNAVGFRSPSMHHNLDWIHELNIEYDASTFDTDPFEPQSDGMLTIFPFWVENKSTQKGYIELPYTLPQDFTLFILMKEKTIDIWKQKLDWIVDNGGMALLNTHPDYMNFDNGNPGLEEYTAEHYRDFLKYIKTNYDGLFWHPLPKEIARFWKMNARQQVYNNNIVVE